MGEAGAGPTWTPIERRAIPPGGRTAGVTQTGGACVQAIAARAVGGVHRTLTVGRKMKKRVHSAGGASLSSQFMLTPCIKIALPGTHGTHSNLRAVLPARRQVAEKLCCQLAHWGPC